MAVRQQPGQRLGEAADKVLHGDDGAERLERHPELRRDRPQEEPGDLARAGGKRDHHAAGDEKDLPGGEGGGAHDAQG